MARHLIDYGKVGFIQVNCGRIGGIGPAKASSGLCGAAWRNLCDPHFHFASGSQRISPALRRTRGAPDMRVSGSSETDGCGPNHESLAT